MAKKFSKSNQNLTFEEVAEIYSYREKSLKLLFSNSNPNFIIDFTGYSLDEINQELREQLEEIEKDACLNLLASIEARLRLDYIVRCEEKHKDVLSRKFRELFADNQHRISLDAGILDEWKSFDGLNSSIISDVRRYLLTVKKN
jgi:hypothetical protein